MYDNESRIERAKRFAKVWWKSRDDVGKSQEFMALSMGVSKRLFKIGRRALVLQIYFRQQNGLEFWALIQ